jgi:hypothetical protein
LLISALLSNTSLALCNIKEVIASMKEFFNVQIWKLAAYILQTSQVNFGPHDGIDTPTFLSYVR